MNWLYMLGIVLALGIMDGIYAQRDEQVRLEAQRLAEEKKAPVFRAVAECLTKPSVITVADKPAADCFPRKR